jgi:aryl-alcohol dehydrogenase
MPTETPEQVLEAVVEGVLGHEGSGIVESVGADVLKVAPGDSVVLTFLTCGRCKPCVLGRMAHCDKTFPLCFGGSRLDGSTATLDGQGEKVHDHFFGQSSFATYALANERNVVKVSSVYLRSRTEDFHV